MFGVVAAVLLPMKEDLARSSAWSRPRSAAMLVTQITKVAKAAAAAYFVIGIADFVWQ